jgi:spore coat polysaccharide biosynthesis protein SpsF
MEALKNVTADAYILACPDDCAVPFAPLAGEAGFEISLGPKEDVLARYCLAIRYFHIDRVIRATADNPFVFADAADSINAGAVSLNADYAGYSGLPYGAGVESVSAEALLKAEAGSHTQAEREHVCPYLYNHGEMFLLHRPLAPLQWQNPALRLTVDTSEDYQRAQVLYESLSRRGAEGRCQGSNIIAAASSLSGS